MILALAACRYASGFLAPLLLAVMAALALAPLVEALARVIPRWIAAAVVVIGDRRRIRPHGVAAVGRSRDVQPAAAEHRPRHPHRGAVGVTPRQSLHQQLQQAVTELEKTAGAAKPTDATPVTIVERSTCSAR